MKQTLRQSPELPWIHWLRVFASFAVICIHVCSKDYILHDVRTSAWQTIAVWEILIRWSVPMFVMITGALLLDPQRALPMKKLFGKYFLRIAVALVFWSLAYAVVYTGLYLRAGLRETLEAAREGYPHLWYLYMLLGLYLVMPLLRPIAADRAAMRWFVLLAGVFSVLLPILGNFGLLPTLRGFALRMDVHAVLGYAGYCVLGRLLTVTETTRRQRLSLYALTLLVTLAGALVDGFGSLARGEFFTPFVDPFSPAAALQAASFFLLAREAGRTRTPSRLVIKLSELSFGIYLIHEVPIDFLRRFCGLSTLTLHPLLSVPLIAVLSLAVAALATAALKKIPLVNRYLV